MNNIINIVRTMLIKQIAISVLILISVAYAMAVDNARVRTSVNSREIVSTDNGMLFQLTHVGEVGHERREMLCSTNDGLTWNNNNKTMIQYAMYGAASYVNTLYGIKDNYQLVKSEDFGATWQEVGSMPAEIDIKTDRVGIYRSRNTPVLLSVSREFANYNVTWMYYPDKGTFSNPIPLQSVASENMWFMKDGRLISRFRDSTLCEWDNDQQVWKGMETTPLPVQKSDTYMYVANGSVFYRYYYSTFVEKNNSWVLVREDNNPYTYANDIQYSDGTISYCYHGMYVASNPNKVMPYQPIINSSFSIYCNSVVEKANGVILDLEDQYYTCEQSNPIVLKELWYSRDLGNGNGPDGLGILSKKTFITNKLPKRSQAAFGFSHDGGYSWHSRVLDKKCPEIGGSIFLTKNDDCIIMKGPSGGCDYVSTDATKTFTAVNYNYTGSKPHNIVVHGDNSFTFATLEEKKNVRRYWKSNSLTSPASELTKMQLSADSISWIVLEGDTAVRFRFRRRYQAGSMLSVLKTVDNGITVETVATTDTIMEGSFSVNTQRLSTSEVAIVLNNADGMRVYTMIYIYNNQDGTLREFDKRVAKTMAIKKTDYNTYYVYYNDEELHEYNQNGILEKVYYDVITNADTTKVSDNDKFGANLAVHNDVIVADGLKFADLFVVGNEIDAITNIDDTTNSAIRKNYSKSNELILITPNPVMNTLTLRNVEGTEHYTIYSSVGERLAEGVLGTTNTLDLTTLGNCFSNGLYYIEVHGTNTKRTGMFSVLR